MVSTWEASVDALIQISPAAVIAIVDQYLGSTPSVKELAQQTERGTRNGWLTHTERRRTAGVLIEGCP
jgi:hypothetical protein